MEVKDIMTGRVVTIRADENVAAAARLLRGCNVGALPVCDAYGRLRGMVTDRDIVTRCVALDSDPQTTRVSEIMTRGIAAAAPGDSVEHCVHTMEREQLRRIPVTVGGKPVGMVTLCDLAREERLSAEFADSLRAVSRNVTRRG